MVIFNNAMINNYTVGMLYAYIDCCAWRKVVCTI